MEDEERDYENIKFRQYGGSSRYVSKDCLVEVEEGPRPLTLR